LILDEANKAKVGLDSAEVKEIRNNFHAILTNAWTGLRVSPTLLADSAKTPAEKERLAAGRVDAYVAQLMKGEAQFVEVPSPLASALHKKYEWKINTAALEKAVAAAQPIRAFCCSDAGSDAAGRAAGAGHDEEAVTTAESLAGIEVL
jgi:hypothetical protein